MVPVSDTRYGYPLSKFSNHKLIRAGTVSKELIRINKASDKRRKNLNFLPECSRLLGHQSEDVLGNDDVKFHCARWQVFDPRKG